MPTPWPTNNKIKIVLGIVLVAFFIFYGHKVVTDNVENDFRIYYDAGEAVLQGENIFDVPGYTYPAFFSIFMVPFAIIGPWPSAIIWFLLNILALWACIKISIRLLGAEKPPIPILLLVIPSLIIGRSIDSNFTNGQVNMMIVWLILISMLWISQRKDWQAGLMMAFATALKITPIIFLPYFIYKRMFVAAGSMVIGLVLFFFFIPSLIFGVEKNNRYHQAITDRLQWFSKDADETGYASGQSLRVFNHYLLAPNNTLSSRYDDRDFYPYHINVTHLNEKQITWITRGMILLLAAFMAWRFWGKIENRGDLTLATECSLLLLAMLIISPVSRKAHFVAQILPFTLIFYCWLRSQSPSRFKTFLLIAMAGAFALNTFTSSGVLGRDISLRLNSYCPLLFSAVLGMIAIFAIQKKLKSKNHL